MSRPSVQSVHLAVAEAVYGDESAVWRGPVTREEQQANRFAAFRAAELKALQGGGRRAA